MKTLTVKNKVYVKCNVTMLPTDTPEIGLPYVTSRITSWFRRVDKGCKGIITNTELSNSKDWHPHHIYVTIDMPIEKNDWVMDIRSKNIYQIKDSNTQYCRRIIATTDKSLHLSDIDMVFIQNCCDFDIKQAFVECEEEYTMGSTMLRSVDKNIELYIKIPIHLIHLKDRKVFV